MKKQYQILIGIAGISFIVGMGAQYMIGSHSANTVSDDKKVLYWVAPMDPNYRRDKPGKSPMGMDLIPVYEGNEKNSDDASIKISPTIEHNLGVRTAKVKRQDISRVIDTVGSIAVDENQIEHTHVYAEGWIKELLVKAEGEHVKKGQLLFRINSRKGIFFHGKKAEMYPYVPRGSKEVVASEENLQHYTNPFFSL